MNDSPNKALTPPQLAKLWQVKPEKVIAFIRSGELRAFDISHNPGIGRPRFRISVDAIIGFENRRSAKQPSSKKKRRKTPANIIEFF